jgi:hypothetical protein
MGQDVGFTPESRHRPSATGMSAEWHIGHLSESFIRLAIWAVELESVEAGLSGSTTVQPCNRSGLGNSSISSGKGSPITNRAGRPFRSSRLRRTPASKAAATRRDTTDLSSFSALLMSACITSSFPSLSRSVTARTVSRTSGLIATSAPSATSSATNSRTAA